LKTLRLKFAQHEALSVIAHRGSGPTNRTRGGLIAQDDERRLTRPAENSKSAFKAALDAAETDTKLGLDGIECDVFLSRDNKAILSHEGAVKEQLSTAQKVVHDALVKDGTHIDDLTEAELLTIKRTEKADSSFISLRGLLDQTIEVARKYNTDIGKPFRVEVEMKGKPSHDDPTYGKRLTDVVAKEISQFKKANPDVFMEIIIFNGSDVDALSYDTVRKKKSKLGNLYTGLGSSSVKDGKKAKVDELRMSLSAANIEKIDSEEESFTDNGFIVTLVPGAEHPLQDMDEDAVGKMTFKALGWNPPIDTMETQVTDLKRWKTAGTKVPEDDAARLAKQAYNTFTTTNTITQKGNNFNQKISETIKQLEGEIKRRKAADTEMLNMGKGDFELVKTLVAKGAKVLANVHLLTDVPKNAAGYKGMIED
jgi:glycerophosphoryl diester phosphodiesterase